ncbi:hypothetical protein OC842_007861 [Tilletia horrida]|uniref:Uncharacterized protein n=1 Tax=Tilletia horrida TaxID=155126 RepID=A0AAN6JGC8_9BASI|nr:hypothetical protein OC842_007861 [Tilletia horrida]
MPGQNAGTEPFRILSLLSEPSSTKVTVKFPRKIKEALASAQRDGAAARTRAEQVAATSCRIGHTHIPLDDIAAACAAYKERLNDIAALQRDKKGLTAELKAAQALIGELNRTIARLEQHAG